MVPPHDATDTGRVQIILGHTLLTFGKHSGLYFQATPALWLQNSKQSGLAKTADQGVSYPSASFLLGGHLSEGRHQLLRRGHEFPLLLPQPQIKGIGFHRRTPIQLPVSAAALRCRLGFQHPTTAAAAASSARTRSGDSRSAA